MNTEHFAEEINAAFRLTTKEQRQTVTENWRMRFPYSELLHLQPDALLVASLLDCEHQALCSPHGYPLTNNYEKMIKLINAYKRVDKPLETVDNQWVSSG